MAERTEDASVSRYELLEDAEDFGLKAGDILICGCMHHAAWAPKKIAVRRRESDGFEPECSQYRGCVRHISGPKL